MKLGMKGRFKLCTYKALMDKSGEFVLDKDGNQVPVAGTEKQVAAFDNLILDMGLNNLHNKDVYNRFFISSDNTEPTIADASVPSIISFSTLEIGRGISTTSSTTPPFYTTAYKTMRFAASGTNDNIAKVAVGWNDGFWAVQLIKDGSGNAVVITKRSDEILDLTYELETHIDVADITGVVSISGQDYNYTLRPAIFKSTWFPNAMWSNPSISRVALMSGNISDYRGQPSGATEELVSGQYTKNNYVDGSHEIGFTITATLGQANFSGGIRSFVNYFLAGNNCMFHQCEFSRVSDGAAIMKTNKHTLTLPTFYLKWGRYNAP